MINREEIYNTFKESELNQEFKTLILNRFDSLCQAMYDCVHNPEQTMKMPTNSGDGEYNRFVTDYQKYNTVKTPPRNINDFKYPIMVFVFFKTEEKACRISREMVEDCAAVGFDLSIGDEYIIDQTPSTFVANSFEDIVNYYEKNKNKKMRFSDYLLNEYFGIEPVELKIDTL
jgi:hypothetical protein